MLKKPRQVPKELLMSRSLNARNVLLESELWRLEKGFAGEIKFDSMTDGMLQNKCNIINGLWLKSGDSIFQIDKVMTFQKKIYLIDVKNYEGDYQYDPDGRLRKADKILKNPLNQLQRADDLFGQLLQQYGLHFTIESYLVYINPEFTLYAPKNESIILPTQVNRFLKKLNTEYSKLNDGHEKLADLLMSLDLVDSPFATYPPYDFASLKKGNSCGMCHKLSTFVNGNKLVCRNCGTEELVDAAIVRNVRELMMLFPEIRITTNVVYEWCGGVVLKRTIRRVLIQNFKCVGERNYRFYM
jgi:hypothetical protein